MDNYAAVMHQMEAYGIKLRPKDASKFPILDKRTTCGGGGKYWYKLYVFRPDAGGQYLVGSFGGYKEGDFEKVAVDWKPLSDAERARKQAEHAAAQAKADTARKVEVELAALGAGDLWRRAAKVGTSSYLVRKGVVGEACRYLPDGSIVVPLLRYDLPRELALRGLQRVFSDGAKRFTSGLAKTGCSLRLGQVQPGKLNLILICEGYATGLTLRMATDHELVVYVALDAGNLVHVVPLVRQLHPECRILICADDDYLTRDHRGELTNVGRVKARLVAKTVPGCDLLWPVFAPATRGPKDTDFNDLHKAQGLETVRRQLGAVLRALRTKTNG